MLPKFSYYSILIHFILVQLSHEVLHMLGVEEANDIQIRLKIIHQIQNSCGKR